jgi:hypothetical protein
VTLSGRRRVSRSGPKDKSFDISKQLVWEAYRQVRANKGAPGVDEQSLAEFEKDLKNNLYKIWNRLSSGTYFPPAVRAVQIPKPQGGVRILGVHGRRQNRADRGGEDVGAQDGTDLPFGLLRVPDRPFGASGAGGVPGTMLEEVVGVGFGHPGLLRLFGS